MSPAKIGLWIYFQAPCSFWCVHYFARPPKLESRVPVHARHLVAAYFTCWAPKLDCWTIPGGTKQVGPSSRHPEQPLAFHATLCHPVLVVCNIFCPDVMCNIFRPRASELFRAPANLPLLHQDQLGRWAVTKCVTMSMNYSFLKALFNLFSARRQCMLWKALLPPSPEL